MKKTKIVWRLKEQPTAESLQELVKSEILTNEEAREILFSSETEEDRDLESLKSEIKFLRELVEKLAKRSEIITTIREAKKTYYHSNPWWEIYTTWCDSPSLISGTGSSINLNSSDAGNVTYTAASSFSNINTF